jgi:hypothetical protein
MVATPRGALLAALAAAGWLGPGLACNYTFEWHGTICPRTRFSLMSSIQLAPGCCRGSNLCPTQSAKHVAGTDRVTPSNPPHPRTCDCGVTPDPPDPCAVTPTCSDRKHNGDEIAIDCGGSCHTCPCTPAPLAMDYRFLTPTRVVNITSRPQCECLSQGGNAFRCPQGNTVDHWTCMYDCADSAAFCREKRHFHTDATGLGVCEHVSQLPDVAPPPPLPPPTNVNVSQLPHVNGPPGPPPLPHVNGPTAQRRQRCGGGIKAWFPWRDCCWKCVVAPPPSLPPVLRIAGTVLIPMHTSSVVLLPCACVMHAPRRTDLSRVMLVTGSTAGGVPVPGLELAFWCWYTWGFAGSCSASRRMALVCLGC